MAQYEKRGGGGGQRKRTAIIIKRGPKRYEFIYGRTYGRGGCSNTRSTLSGYATAVIPNKSGRLLVTIIEARGGGGGEGGGDLTIAVLKIKKIEETSKE